MLPRPCVKMSAFPLQSPWLGVSVLPLLCSVWSSPQVCGFSSPSSGARLTLWELTPDSSSPQFLPVASPSFPLFSPLTWTFWWRNTANSLEQVWIFIIHPSIHPSWPTWKMTHIAASSARVWLALFPCLALVPFRPVVFLAEPPRATLKESSRKTFIYLLNSDQKKAEFRTRTIRGELSESEDGVGVKVNLSNHESLNWRFFASCRVLHPPFPSNDF